MSARTSSYEAAGIASVGELLGHAYALELEAHNRYAELAELMDTHNNAEVAELFREMARIEGLHAREIRERFADLGVRDVPAWELRWPDAEGPETAPHDDLHYLMTPHQALRIALAGEQRAVRFFSVIAREAADARMRDLAEQFADEERAHVALVEQWLASYPPPGPGWDDDLDPPASQE